MDYMYYYNFFNSKIVSLIKMTNQTFKKLSPKKLFKKLFPKKRREKSGCILKKNSKNGFSKTISAPVGNNWFFVSDSIKGKSHIKNGTECQDNHFTSVFEELDGWGIAIVCDGAGSASNSHLGSSFMAKKAIPHYFLTAIKNKQWHLHTELPSEEEWKEEAWEQLKNSYGALKYYAENDLKVELSTLACTAIIIIYSPLGLLVTHIGDGRAAYRDEDGKWEALIKPHKGEEANMTYFTTSITWLVNKHFILPDGNTIPESRIIRKKTTAFTLLSDGMENHSFQCSFFDTEIQKWKDPNQPFEKFFEPLIIFIDTHIKDHQSSVDIHERWHEFLTDGNEKIKNEEDDKTMILAVLKQK